MVRDNGTGIDLKLPPNFQKTWRILETLRCDNEKIRQFSARAGRPGTVQSLWTGNIAEWDVTYPKGKILWTLKVRMTASNLKEVVIFDEEEGTSGQAHSGVTLTISNLHKDYNSITSDAGFQEFTEIFASTSPTIRTFRLSTWKARIDPASVIASQGSLNLSRPG